MPFTFASEPEQDPQEDQILHIQLEQAYHQLPISLLVNLLNSLLLAVILWSSFPASRLIVWLAGILIVTGLRYGLYRAYRDQHRRGGRPAIDWRRGFLIGALLSGLVWGSAGLLLHHPDSFPHQMFLLFALGGMIAGALPLLSFLPPAFTVFAIPAALPITFQMALQDDRIHLTMAAMVVIFISAMMASSAQFHRVFRESIELRLRLSSSLEEGEVLAQLARLDTLTGIANRRLFDEALDAEWKRALRNGTRLSLVMADIDHFKLYNDHLGHVAGDACLAMAAEAMATVARRPGDLVARIGGEEFAFLLPNTTLEDAQAIAEHVRDDVQALLIPHPASPIMDIVTVSLGVADIAPSPWSTPSDLVKAADAALYRAKSEGRNRISIAID